jgi:hypothetical protein
MAAEATAEIIRRSGYEVKIHDKVNVVLIDGEIYYADIQPVGKYGPECKVKYRFPSYLDIIGTTDSINIFRLSVKFHGKCYDKQNPEIYRTYVENPNENDLMKFYSEKNSFIILGSTAFIAKIEPLVKKDLPEIPRAQIPNLLTM